MSDTQHFLPYPPLQQLQAIAVSQHEGIALVELNRPDKANALHGTLWSEIRQCFETLDTDSSIRVVVLSARGKHFCAGIDLSLLAELQPQADDPGRAAEFIQHAIRKLQADLNAIEQCRKPVLAAVDNACVGAGLDMLCCTDLRYCTESAYFSIKEIDIGMAADVGTLQRLPKLIADGVVRELAYTGRKLHAAEAQQVGLVNRTFANRDELLKAVLETAAEIASKSPLAIRGTKQALLYARDHSVADSLNQIATWNGSALIAGDLQAAVEAQLTGTQPEFSD